MKQLRSTTRELHELFERRLTVRQIAAFDLKVARPEEDAVSVQRSLLELDIDVVPVRSDARVLGYVVRDELRDGPCGSQARPFEPGDLIAESTPLLDVFGLLRGRPWLFVLDRNEVAGIVTRGDLRKAPVRMFLFALVNLLEMHLTRLVRHHWPNESWRQLLKPKRLEAAEDLLSRRRKLNEALGLLECLQLCDKREIAAATPKILEAFGLSTPGDAHGVLSRVEAPRNRIAHAQDLVEGSSWKELFDLAEQIEQMVRRCEDTSLVSSSHGA